jgi:hypothetical protein
MDPELDLSMSVENDGGTDLGSSDGGESIDMVGSVKNFCVFDTDNFDDGCVYAP